MENTDKASENPELLPFLRYGEDGQEEPSIGQDSERARLRSEEKAFKEAMAVMVEGLEPGSEEPGGETITSDGNENKKPVKPRAKKIQIGQLDKIGNGKEKSLLTSQMSEEEVAQWWQERRAIINQALFELALSKRQGSVRALELIKKLTGELKEKPPSLTLNIVTPDELARRNLQALKKSEEFRASLSEEG